MSRIFLWSEYITHQSQVLLDYFQWSNIMQIGGRVLHDNRITTILPWYELQSQAQIIKILLEKIPSIKLTYVIDAKDLIRDRQFNHKYYSFEKFILKELAFISSLLWKKMNILIVLMDNFIPPQAKELKDWLSNSWYDVELFNQESVYNIYNKEILCSYKHHNLIQHQDISMWNILSYHNIQNNHPLQIISEFFFPFNNRNNLSILDQHINNIDSYPYSWECKKVIEEYRSLIEKLIIWGYNEEEELNIIDETLKRFSL